MRNKSRKPRLPRAPLPKQRSEPHKLKRKVPWRKQKYKDYADVSTE